MLRGIYRHLRTDNLYFVIGKGRAIETPEDSIVIYKQLYESELKRVNNLAEKIHLPVNSIWTIRFDDFEKKANIAYSRHRQNLSSFLKDKLTDGSSLYCWFWFDYARNNSSLSAYDQVRRFITREEGIRFAKDI